MTEGRTPAEMAGLYEWPRVVAVTGALGSGKTEFVLNLARGLKERGDVLLLVEKAVVSDKQERTEGCYLPEEVHPNQII